MRGLQRRANRGGVLNIRSHIIAKVDPGKHRVGRRIHQKGEADADAIGRGAAAGPGMDVGDGEIMGMKLQGFPQGDGMGLGAALTFRRDDTDFPPGKGGLCQPNNSAGGDTVIIGDQDSFHLQVPPLVLFLSFLFSSHSISSERCNSPP